MLSAFLLACRDALAPAQRRALLISLGLAALVFVALLAAFTLFLDRAHPFGAAWLDVPVTLLGEFAVLALAWLLYPMAVTVALGFFLDGVILRLERAYYPDAMPERRAALGELLSSFLRLSLATIALNLLALPFYLWPAINFFIYYGVNGYLLGRGYFELVAFRHWDRAAQRAIWHRYRGRLMAAGVIIAGLLSLPIIDLAAPLVAAAFMLHLVMRLELGRSQGRKSDLPLSSPGR